MRGLSGWWCSRTRLQLLATDKDPLAGQRPTRGCTNGTDLRGCVKMGTLERDLSRGNPYSQGFLELLLKSPALSDSIFCLKCTSKRQGSSLPSYLQSPYTRKPCAKLWLAPLELGWALSVCAVPFAGLVTWWIIIASPMPGSKVPSRQPYPICPEWAGCSVPLPVTRFPGTPYHGSKVMGLTTFVAAVPANCLALGLPSPQHLFKADTVPGKAGTTLSHFSFLKVQHQVCKW